MDIEERAEKWVTDFANGIEGFTKEDMIDAYLAGSAQTQADYSKYLACPRCECSCGAR